MCLRSCTCNFSVHNNLDLQSRTSAEHSEGSGGGSLLEENCCDRQDNPAAVETFESRLQTYFNKEEKKLSKYHLQSGCLLPLQNLPSVVLLFEFSSFVASNTEFLF